VCRLIDVEQDVLFRCNECPKIHWVAVTASLDRNPSRWFMPEILCHYGGRAAKESERVRNMCW
jgi:hypothetical protein